MHRDIGNSITCRTYGDAGPLVILLHGGPGAPGYLAPLARVLGARFRVLEPFQRRADGAPLTVARHVDDLQALIAERCAGESPFIVGHSWGAMLALAHSAAHPSAARAIVLVGCGTFDEQARAVFRRNVAERGGERLQRRLDAIARRPGDATRKLKLIGSASMRVFAVDHIKFADESAEPDARGHEETWADMLRLQADGTYPAAFSAITSPVLMLHGADDEHPGSMVRDALQRHLPQLEYREFAKCGHYPWLERAARDAFHEALQNWLLQYSDWSRGSCGDL